MDMPAKPSPAAGKEMQTPSTQNQVMVENFSFQPGTLTVAPGTTVTWVNHDDEPHTVNENNKTFKSGTLDTDAKFSYCAIDCVPPTGARHRACTWSNQGCSGRQTPQPARFERSNVCLERQPAGDRRLGARLGNWCLLRN